MSRRSRTNTPHAMACAYFTRNSPVFWRMSEMSTRGTAPREFHQLDNVCILNNASDNFRHRKRANLVSALWRKSKTDPAGYFWPFARSFARRVACADVCDSNRSLSKHSEFRLELHIYPTPPYRLDLSEEACEIAGRGLCSVPDERGQINTRDIQYNPTTNRLSDVILASVYTEFASEFRRSVKESPQMQMSRVRLPRSCTNALTYCWSRLESTLSRWSIETLRITMAIRTLHDNGK